MGYYYLDATHRAAHDGQMNPFDMPQSLLQASRYFADEEVCHNFLSEIRWPNGCQCPACGSANIGALSVTRAKSRSKNPNAKPTVRRLWTCKECRKQFTVKTGTIFEDSALSLSVWLPAVWMIVSAKNGISSCELARSLDISQKSAWFMLHRIREAMREGNFPLKGEVEVDETYIGGRIKTINAKQRRKVKGSGMGHAHLTPVFGAIQRGTDGEPSKVQVKHVPNVRRATLLPEVLRRVGHGSKIYSDKSPAYKGLEMAYDHQSVDHAIEYVRGAVHINGLENFWSILSRMFHGTYVQISDKHLARYLDEQATRFNERTGSDLTRFLSTLRRVIGRRLTYADLISSPDGAASAL